MNYKITHDKKDCIGCCACEQTAPENWEMKEEKDGMKAKPTKTDITDKELKTNMEAAQACPVNVIHIHNKKKERLI